MFKTVGKPQSWFLVAAILLALSSSAAAQLRLSPNGRYLVEADGSPVFLNGESAWCLFTAITYPQAEGFFQNCRQYGINFLQTMLIENGFSANSPANTNGDTPFTGTPFATPRERYFTHADSIIGLAKRYGIYLHLYISYLGFSSNEGWQMAIGNASIADMKLWGAYVGTRYRDSTNIIWGISGDCDPTQWQQKLDSMVVAGLLPHDPNHPIVPRDEPYTRTQTHWSGRPWLKLEYIYPYWGPVSYLPERIYQMAWDIYSEGRAGFMEEAWYENEHTSGGSTYPTNAQLRRQMYYGPLAGALVGQVFGNCPIWHFNTGSNPVCGTGSYQSWLNSAGHVSTMWCGKLFRSRYWYKMKPDRDSIVMTAGTLTGSTRAICSSTTDSSSIIAFLPTQRSVTINPAVLKGDSIRAWWFNPSNGDATIIGTYSKTSRSYNPPSSGDWVLVIDSRNFNFNQPGNLAPTLVSPSNSSTGQSLNPRLIWNTTLLTQQYDVQIASDPQFSMMIFQDSLLADTSRQVSGLGSGTTYYWRVRGRQIGVLTDWSSAWSFTTVAGAPATPVLLDPPNGATNQPASITLDWGAVTGASTYHFQLAGDSLFALLVVNDSSLQNSSRQASNLQNATAYYWRVRARNEFGVSPWSQAWFFFTGTQIVQPVHVGRGWNLVSVPVSLSDRRTQSIFPSATSSAYGYQPGIGYNARDTLTNGTGYWLKFDSTETLQIAGASILADSVAVTPGWNLIGSVSAMLDTASIITIPPAIRVSRFYAYTGTYSAASSIAPGSGYWVKMNGPGLVILSTPYNKRQFAKEPVSQLPTR